MTSEMTSTTTTVEIQAPGQSRLIPAIGAGAAAALIGAVIWAVVTVTTKFQIGWMAVGVGFIVGYAVRTVGRGSTPIFGVAGAILALMGCLMGNLLSACGFFATEASMSVWTVLGRLNLDMAISLIQATFQPMDLLFYGIAIYEGFKLSFHKG